MFERYADAAYVAGQILGIEAGKRPIQHIFNAAAAENLAALPPKIRSGLTVLANASSEAFRSDRKPPATLQFPASEITYDHS